MLSTMQDIPLSVSRILRYGSTVHRSARITTWHNGESEVSDFGTVGARAAAFAHALHDDLGITGDQRVGSFMFNCAEHLEVMFAACSKGAVFTPLNKQLMADQIQHIINHAQVQVIVADPRLAHQLGSILTSVDCVQAVVFTGLGTATEPGSHIPPHIKTYSYEALLDGRSTEYAWPEVDERQAAALCYSTGTTGAPKGVVYSHRSIYLEAMQLRCSDSLAVTHGETFLCCIPIYHVLSWGVPFAAFMTGTPLVLPDSDISAPTLATMIAATHPRVAHGVPSVWMQLMVHYQQNPPERMSLTEIYAGGSPAPPSLIKMWEERYGVDVIHVWGMAETSTVGTVARPPQGASGDARWAYRVSQGRFPASLRYRIVHDGQVVPKTDRNVGELQVRGNLVTGSYFQSSETHPGGAASTFRGEAVEDDASAKFTADGWLRTGDVGSVTADGFLTIEDRARDVIRSGGEWIYSVQLENLVMASNMVVEAAVIGYPDKRWGERPLAVAVLRQGYFPTIETAEKIRETMQGELPNWMLPEYWTFVKSIDKTSVGKFDKKDLRAHLAAGEFNIVKLAGPGENRGAEYDNFEREEF
ncbi:long-chain fatty acid--CoA ligase [Corynebacterium phocae]|uniref:Long-chain fatty acid--CoA ligase n=1 Tax=Corynebacterium phocae TaxID=161895 RepID=A0A1L7D4A9_9CORY|nr:long-chain fatty-acid--CoA ligase [Corynebacterium phocae]APT92772.1 long-chain fatty acid--CoA ligase [Corynebacterium phocae]KAA8723083.1 long-chain fatty-acid--CoA ligase [Corynebacterium phocae]